MINLYRFFLILVLVFITSISEKCLADMSESHEKLPVIINRGYKIVGEENLQALLGGENRKSSSIGELNREEAGKMRTPNTKQGTRVVPVEEKTNIDYGKIGDLVSLIRSKLCSVNQEGSYEVWLQVEGGASGVFVSASAQTGIKAIINCSAEHK